MLELVIFDCDGVLVDSERLAIKVDVQVLAQLGWAIAEEEIIERFVGVSGSDFRRAIEAHLGRRLPEDWEDQVEPLYRSVFARELRPVDGIVEALDQITVASCVASSGTHDKMRYTLGLAGLYERFRGRIFSATEVERGKPAPDLFLHAAEQMGVQPASCAVVEDSVNGVAAARAAGMKVFAYGGGVTSSEKLAGPNTTVFSDMRELPRLLADRRPERLEPRDRGSQRAVARYANAEFSRDVIERFPDLREELQLDENLLQCQIATLAAAARSAIDAADTYLPLRICAFLDEALRRFDAVNEIEAAVALSFLERQELRRAATGRYLLRSMPEGVRRIILEHEASIGEW